MPSPESRAARNDAVNESPAPTVSATSTRGVGRYDRVSGANTELPAAPQVRITIRNPYLSSSVRHCSPGCIPSMPNMPPTTASSSSFIFRMLHFRSDSSTTCCV